VVVGRDGTERTQWSRESSNSQVLGVAKLDLFFSSYSSPHSQTSPRLHQTTTGRDGPHLSKPQPSSPAQALVAMGYPAKNLRKRLKREQRYPLGIERLLMMRCRYTPT
jgi:hypothetical protein